MKAYWWNAKPNFGDSLTPFLLEHILGITPSWAPADKADVVVVGSVIDVLAGDYRGIIAGSGKLHAYSPIPREAHVLGLRGLLTAHGVSQDVAIGDPALLVSEIVPVQEKIHNLVVVPHWTDDQLAKRFAHLNPVVIDPMWPPITVITEIAQAKKVVSSSLHGIIIADAFGVPRRAEMFPLMGTKREGGVYKFEDYSSGIDFPMEFGVLQQPPRPGIERAQDELFDMFMTLGDLFSEENQPSRTLQE